MEAYETIVRRAERALGRQLTDHEVILFLGEEIEQLREKIRQLEQKSSCRDEFERFRKKTFSEILNIFEGMSEENQQAFDIGEMYGRLKTLEEAINI